MAFKIDSLKEVVQRVRNSFRAELPGSDAYLWPNNIYVSAKVMGGAIWEIFGKLSWIDKQRFAMTATGDELTRHGAEYGITRKPASFARGNLTVTGTYPYTVPADTVFTRSDGVEFKSSAAVAIGQFTGTATVPVIASATGKAGNTVDGASLTTTATLLSSVVDDFGLGQGTDGESEEDFRARVLARKRQPPHGGAWFDYVAWAKEIPGVTRVFVAGNYFGPGTVAVWFLMDETYNGGIPQATDVAAVQAHLDLLKPVTATVFVIAPIPECIDIEIGGLSPNTAAVREAAVAELLDLFRNMTTVGLPNKPFLLHRSWLWQAVSNAAGENYHVVAAPLTDLTFATGIMPCLRNVRFNP